MHQAHAEMSAARAPYFSTEHFNRLIKSQIHGAYVRSGASLFMLFLALIAFFWDAVSLPAIKGVGASVAFITAINPPAITVMKRNNRRRVFEALSVGVNILEILGYTAVIYFLGGIRAAYMTLVYAAVVNYVGIVAPRRIPFIIAGLCACSFTAMVTLEHFGFLPHQSSTGVYQTPWPEVVFIVSVFTAMIFIVAFISAYVSEFLKKTRDKLRYQNQIQTQANEKLQHENRERIRAEEELRKRHLELLSLNKALENAREQTERQHWIKSRQTDLNNLMQWEQDLGTLAQTVIRYLARQLNAQVGVLYIVDHKEHLEPAGHYATKHDQLAARGFAFGEGLVGQAAQEKRPILATDVPRGYLSLTSGSFEAEPNVILVHPLLYNGEVRGMVELGSLENFRDIHREFLDSAGNNIAFGILAAQNQSREIKTAGQAA